MTAEIMYIIIWAVGFVFFAIVEIANGAGLFTIWFALASLISMFCAIAKLPFLVQFIVFVVASIILLIASRPLAGKIRNKAIPTNYELDIGKNATVIEGIDNALSKGRVKLDGTDWAARSADGRPIANGSTVTVVQIEGSKLIVAPK